MHPLMLLEDEAHVARTLARALPRGLPIEIVDSVRSARALVGRGPFSGYLGDVIVRDGELGGVEILDAVLEVAPETPCVLISGGADPRAVDRARRLGVAFLSKPVDRYALAPFVGAVLGGPLRSRPPLAAHVVAAGMSLGLTASEHEVLAWHVSGGRAPGFVAAHDVQASTYKTYVRGILAKAAVHPTMASLVVDVLGSFGRASPPPYECIMHMSRMNAA